MLGVLVLEVLQPLGVETPVNIKVVNVKELKNDKQSNASGTTGSRSRNQTN